LEYRYVGRSGLQVSTLCLGTMMFGRFGNRDQDECVNIIHRSLDAGINFIDTADVYSAGESEEIVAKALVGGRRDEVILATKCYFSVEDGPLAADPPPNSYGASRRHVIRACEASLRRLGTDWIDLYQVHRPDFRTDIDETLAALSQLVQQGKVRAIGSSSFPAPAIVEAQWVAERRCRERFLCEQPQYSIFVRGIERDVLPTCQRYGMGVIVWSPLNAGWLSGKRRRDTEGSGISSRRSHLMPGLFDVTNGGTATKFDLLEQLEAIATEIGLSLPQLAVAWTLEHPAVSSAIVGPRTLEHLAGLLGADENRLPPEALDRIDELVQPGTIVSSSDDRRIEPALLDSRLRRRTAH
jgi:aryl-alcohol dehydrogenase-like predicted oxidoreductase